MRIHVMYKGGKMGSVDQCKIDKLINSRQITKFLRSDGWVTIGVDAIRINNSSYHQGPERRKMRYIET